MTVTCGVLGLCRQAYNRWIAQPISDRDWGDAHLVNAIRGINDDDPEFGYQLVTDELHRLGWRVWRTGSAR